MLLVLTFNVATITARSLHQACNPPPVRVTKARLVDGGSPRQGRLEVSFDGVTFGTVCDSLSAAEAAMVCRFLGFKDATPENSIVRYGTPQTGSDPPLVPGMPVAPPYGPNTELNISIYGLNCNPEPKCGDCASCWDGCTMKLTDDLFPPCGHGQDVGIVCLSSAKLCTDFALLFTAIQLSTQHSTAPLQTSLPSRQPH